MSNPVCQTTLAFHSHTQITARFDGGNLTSDAGWLLFGSLDRQDRLCEDFSSCIADSRDQRYVRHEQLKLIRQRVFQIVAGYEDCNDADTLRSDSTLRRVIGSVSRTAEESAWVEIHDRVPPSLRDAMDKLLEVPAGARHSTLFGLKRYPPEPNPTSILAYLEKIELVQSLGLRAIDLGSTEPGFLP